MLADTTQHQLTALAKERPHACLLVGQRGVGVTQAVTYYAQQAAMNVEWVYPEKKEVVDTESGVISIDVIRRLYDSAKTRAAQPRLFALYRAETMTPQAQNAFLKLLEEPNASSHFILAVEGTHALLPTIMSRVQAVEVRPLTHQQSQKLLADLHVTDPTKTTQLLFLADGLANELTKLATDDNYFTQRSQIIKDARSLVQGSGYEKQQVAIKYKDTRPDALALLEAAMKLVEASLTRSASDASLKTLEKLSSAHEAIAQNGHIRLQLTAVVI